MKHFYPQSLPLTTDELQEAEGRAVTQEERIYLFIKYSEDSWTAWELQEAFPWYCITSIRRALFNLEKRGKITRSGWVKGPRGVKVGKYIAFTGKLF